MSLYSTEMGDHFGIIIFSSILLILRNSLISLTELHKSPNISSVVQMHIMSLQPAHDQVQLQQL